jgi:hypothetical protein
VLLFSGLVPTFWRKVLPILLGQKGVQEGGRDLVKTERILSFETLVTAQNSVASQS